MKMTEAMEMGIRVAPAEMADRLRAACARFTAETESDRKHALLREWVNLSAQSLRLCPREMRRTPEILDASETLSGVKLFLSLQPKIKEWFP